MPNVRSASQTPLSSPPFPGTSERWAMLLDVDGTLLDFDDNPQTVVAPHALQVLLHDLHRALGGALALVSGRSLGDIDRIFGRTCWAAAGLHGLELRHADGSFRRKDVTAERNQQMRAAVAALAERFDGVQVEDKQGAIALHCRRDPRRLAALHQAADILLPELAGYELQPGREVLEFKPVGMDKGKAVRELLMRPPFSGRTPVYLGDDLTDEFAFRKVNHAGGISVRVGNREPTRARYTLAGPDATAVWLQRVLETLTCGDPAQGEIGARQPQRRG